MKKEDSHLKGRACFTKGHSPNLSILNYGDAFLVEIKVTLTQNGTTFSNYLFLKITWVFHYTLKKKTTVIILKRFKVKAFLKYYFVVAVLYGPRTDATVVSGDNMIMKTRLPVRQTVTAKLDQAVISRVLMELRIA